MKKKGRRLKRYLGLRREKATSTHRGGIEHLLPGRISGWVAAPGRVSFQEVRLLVGPHLIACADINQPRPDVCEALGWQGLPGFSLVLPAELPPVDWQGWPRVLAISADGTQKAELELMGRPERTATLLKALLQSEMIGLEGHCDGLLQGSIRGWAGRPGQHQPARIWLQSSGLNPFPVLCDLWRDGMTARNLPERCGFGLDPKDLPGEWAGREVWFTFDPQGQFRLPQVEPLVLPAAASSAVVVPASAIPSGVASAAPVPRYQSQLREAPEDLRAHWEALEQFRLDLDRLEEELDRRDRMEQHQTLSNPSPPRKFWWSRLFDFRPKAALPASRDH